MDDIVKRIRQQSYFGPEPYEAANEIEQLRQRVQELESLRKENKQLQTSFDAQCVSADKLFDECAELRQRVQELEQQLTEARLAERERVIKVITPGLMTDQLIKIIRAME